MSVIDLVFSSSDYGSNNDFDTVLTIIQDKIDNNASEYVVDASGNYLKIRLVRDDAINNLDTKIVVLFPYNTDATTNIWTNSTFGFETDEGDDITYDGIKYKYKILNDVFSQEPAVNDRILVPCTRSIKMEFIPTKPLYNGLDVNGDVLTSDISLNKFEIVIPTEPDGYTNNEFITAINVEFDTINTNYTDNHNTKIFNKNAK